MAVDGTYNISMDTPMGKQDAELILNSEGAVLSGSMKSPMGTETFNDGTVSGDDAEWAVKIKGPMGKMKLKFSANVDGDRISGKVKALIGSSSFEGARIA